MHSICSVYGRGCVHVCERERESVCVYAWVWVWVCDKMSIYILVSV